MQVLSDALDQPEALQSSIEGVVKSSTQRRYPTHGLEQNSMGFGHAKARLAPSSLSCQDSSMQCSAGRFRSDTSRTCFNSRLLSEVALSRVFMAHAVQVLDYALLVIYDVLRRQLQLADGFQARFIASLTEPGRPITEWSLTTQSTCSIVASVGSIESSPAPVCACASARCWLRRQTATHCATPGGRRWAGRCASWPMRRIRCCPGWHRTWQGSHRFCHTPHAQSAARSWKRCCHNTTHLFAPR